MFKNSLVVVFALLFSVPCLGQDSFETISFESKDGLKVTGDLYLAHEDLNTPFIVLCHQARWSRGEYREIAPKLNKLGFNCLAIDQRSGGAVNDVANETLNQAKENEKGTGFLDAEQDIIAAVEHAKENWAKGKTVLWGSSYSAALSLRITGEHADLVDGVLAFAPGEYFARFGKPNNYIASSAAKIQVPAFITSAKNEHRNWKGIYDAISTDSKKSFLPESKGNHGSRALWEQFDDHDDYWTKVKEFLGTFK